VATLVLKKILSLAEGSGLAVCLDITIQQNTGQTSVSFVKMKFLRSQTTSGAGLKFFEWVFERKKNKLEYFSKTFKNISKNCL
jgi:archaellin